MTRCQTTRKDCRTRSPLRTTGKMDSFDHNQYWVLFSPSFLDLLDSQRFWEDLGDPQQGTRADMHLVSPIRLSELGNGMCSTPVELLEPDRYFHFLGMPTGPGLRVGRVERSKRCDFQGPVPFWSHNRSVSSSNNSLQSTKVSLRL